MTATKAIVTAIAAYTVSACATTSSPANSGASSMTQNDAGARLARYTTVKLEPDLSALTPNERRMIPVLIDAAKAMDDVYWIQTYGDRVALMRSIGDDATRRFAEINYGPWDRLDNNHVFVPGASARPAGANFYPADITKAEFDAAVARNEALKSLYTMVRRDVSG